MCVCDGIKYNVAEACRVIQYTFACDTICMQHTHTHIHERGANTVRFGFAYDRVIGLHCVQCSQQQQFNL